MHLATGLAEIRRVVESDDSAEMCRCELLSDRVLLALVAVAEKADVSDGTKPSEDEVAAALDELRAALNNDPIACSTCRGAGGTTQDAWSYGGAGRAEGHYTIDHDCPCCKGEGSFQSPREAEEHRGHDGSEHEPDPGEPLEPDIDDRDHVQEDED